jgi:hypothetical protein
VDAVFYWDMTFKEIAAAIKAKQKINKNELKQQAELLHSIATLVGIAVNAPKKYPPFEKAFPKLCEPQENENTKEQKPVQQPWEIMKARVNAYAAEAERRKRGAKKNGDK